MIWRGVVGKQGLLRNPELIRKWMQVCSSHTQPARYQDGKHPEWLSDRAAMAQLVARRDHNRRMRSSFAGNGGQREMTEEERSSARRGEEGGMAGIRGRAGQNTAGSALSSDRTASDASRAARTERMSPGETSEQSEPTQLLDARVEIFQLEQQKRRRSAAGGGKVSDTNHREKREIAARSKWKLSAVLSFLDPCITPRETSGNMGGGAEGRGSQDRRVQREGEREAAAGGNK
ncbi:hypothetical protein EYF80_012248 [Liparis tanakae]|uniref:Uncharacterized protein n=1 Tax=Liparis tanakae TaxID=230148 RepID=A0A4Z2IJ19_9TELE|nr:hypothetical protein EYF80_012248 [Liparis tanakae]